MAILSDVEIRQQFDPSECILLYKDESVEIHGRPAVEVNAGEFWVTFSHYCGREPFGQAVIDRRACGVAYIIARQDNWYQNPSMPALMKTVRTLAHGAPIKVYGSSMGGFAALLFSEVLGADLVLAITPQVFLNPCAAFDFRWSATWEAMASRNELLWPNAKDKMTRKGKVYVAFDPYDREDRHHILPLADCSNVVLLTFPFAHHSMAATLKELSLLRPLLEAAADKHDEKLFEIRGTYIARRRESSLYYVALARRFYEQKNYAACLTLLGKCFTKAPVCIHEYVYEWMDTCLAVIKADRPLSQR